LLQENSWREKRQKKKRTKTTRQETRRGEKKKEKKRKETPAAAEQRRQRVEESGRGGFFFCARFFLISRSVSRPLIFYNGYKKENKYQKEEKVVNNISKKIEIFYEKIIKKVRRIKEI